MITPVVVLLSLISLILIVMGSRKTNGRRSLGFAAGVCLLIMVLGAIGTGLLPKAYFGIPERMSVLRLSTLMPS